MLTPLDDSGFSALNLTVPRISLWSKNTGKDFSFPARLNTTKVSHSWPLVFLSEKECSVLSPVDDVVAVPAVAGLLSSFRAVYPGSCSEFSCLLSTPGELARAGISVQGQDRSVYPAPRQINKCMYL